LIILAASGPVRRKAGGLLHNGFSQLLAVRYTGRASSIALMGMALQAAEKVGKAALPSAESRLQLTKASTSTRAESPALPERRFFQQPIHSIAIRIDWTSRKSKG